MHLRQHSEVGWLMLQLMGGLCLPFVTRDAQKRASAKERLTALFHGRAGGKTLDLHAAQRRHQQESGPRAGTDRVTVSDLPQTRSPGPAPSVMEPSDMADAMAYAMTAFRDVDSGRYTGTLAEALPGESLVARALRLVEKYPKPKGKRGPLPVVVFDELADFNLTARDMAILSIEHCSHCGALLGGMYGTVCMTCDVDPPEEDTRTYSTQESLWWLSFADDTTCAGVAIVRLEGEQSTARALDVAQALGITPAGAWQTMGIHVPLEEQAQCEPHAGRFLTPAEAAAAFEAQSIRTFEEENPGREVDPGSFGVVDP